MLPSACSSVYLQYFGLAATGQCFTPGSKGSNYMGAGAMAGIALMYTLGQTTRVLADSW